LPGLGRLEPWQGTFMIMALPGLVLALLLFTMREPPRLEGQVKRPGIGAALAHVKATGDPTFCTPSRRASWSC
jgi:hypothetical protein